MGSYCGTPTGMMLGKLWERYAFGEAPDDSITFMEKNPIEIKPYDESEVKNIQHQLKNVYKSELSIFDRRDMLTLLGAWSDNCVILRHYALVNTQGIALEHYSPFYEQLLEIYWKQIGYLRVQGSMDTSAVFFSSHQPCAYKHDNKPLGDCPQIIPDLFQGHGRIGESLDDVTQRITYISVLNVTQQTDSAGVSKSTANKETSSMGYINWKTMAAKGDAVLRFAQFQGSKMQNFMRRPLAAMLDFDAQPDKDNTKQVHTEEL